MLCDDGVDEEYRGLDSERDTEEEVESAIILFPDVLSRRELSSDVYPIHRLVKLQREDRTWRINLKALSFIPLVVRLSIELGLFEEQERGGLFSKPGCYNPLEYLGLNDQTKRYNREHHEPIDDKCLQVLIQLRNMDLFKKEDIRKYRLVNMILRGDGYYFPEKRFRFLIEWDPIALTQTDGYLYLPIYYATKFFTMKAFRRVFEYGIRYYPKKKGFSLLFKKGREDRTPFQAACKAFLYKDVMEVINETLARNSDIPVNIADALITAAIDENIRLDCVYFLLRRQPDVLQKSL